MSFNVSIAVSFTSDYEKQLIDHIFEDYNSAVRPVINDSDAVEVKLGLTISQIIDVVCSSSKTRFFIGKLFIAKALLDF